jgi:RimJ/RimL family protein N-acetyltransferase
MTPPTWTALAHTQLSGKHVILKPLNPAKDTPELFKISHGSKEKEAVWNYLPYGPFLDEQAMETWVVTDLLLEATLLPWVIADANNGAFLGFVALTSIVAAHGRAEIGHVWLTPSAHKTKANTEAQYLLLSHAFDTSSYRRVEWRCNSLNHASRTAAMRLGFLFEGRFRKHMFLKGANRDTDWFAMTDSDWPRVKKNFRLYLDSTEPVSLMKLNTI